MDREKGQILEVGMAGIDDKFSSLPIEHSEGDQGEGSLEIKRSDPLSNAVFPDGTGPIIGPARRPEVDWEQGAPKAREGKRPVMRIVPMFDANSKRGALICG